MEYIIAKEFLNFSIIWSTYLLLKIGSNSVRSFLTIGNYVKGMSLLDALASEVLHTYIPAKEISGTGSPILDRITLGKPGEKIFPNIVMS